MVKKLQTVQNEAVRVIAGAFHTAPHEPLHQLLTILLMDLRLTMLTQNLAIRLYKVSKESQLLRQLEGDWYEPQPHDAPLPSPNNHRACTALRSLAARVPVRGPRIETFPDLPPGAPSWEGRVQCIPKQSDWDYPQTAATFINLNKEGRTINIFSTGLRSNRNRNDDRQLGAASVVLYHHGREWKHIEKVVGEMVMESDTALQALIPSLDALSDFLKNQQIDSKWSTLIFTASSFTVHRAFDASPHEEQSTSIKCLTKLGELIITYPHLEVRLLWLPRSTNFVGFKRAKQLAHKAICMAELRDDKEPHTIKDQKAKTREAAVTNWAQHWHQMPHSSLAYKTALTKLPDSWAHPVFLAAQNEAKSSRKTLCTLYRVITGHAFIGSYTQRFYLNHTQDQIACSCGEPVQTVEHVLLNCPLHTTTCRKYLTANSRPRNLSQLFNHPKRITAMIQFLEETSVCAKPQMEWEPG